MNRKDSNYASSSRRLAYQALFKARKSKMYVTDAIDDAIDTSSADRRDRSYATLLAMGTTKTCGALDYVIDRCLDSPSDIKDDVRDILRICAYELAFLRKEPYAVVDQGVRLAKEVNPKAAGLVNAISRRIAKASKAFPFGDSDNSIEAYSLEQGFPVWLVEYAMRSIGKDEARRLIESSNEPPLSYAFLNTMRFDMGNALSALDRNGCELERFSFAGACMPLTYLVKNPDQLFKAKLRRASSEGMFLISDPSAQLISQIVAYLLAFPGSADIDLDSFNESYARHASKANLRSDGKAQARLRQEASLLELCCGKGGKAIMVETLFELLSGTKLERHIALDNVPSKVSTARRRLECFGASSCDLVVADAKDLGERLPGEEFSVVFVDAPCTGLGTLRRHPDIRWRASSQAVIESSRLSFEILREASKHVEEDGVLVYSTCTFSPHENEMNIARFMETPEGKHFRQLKIFGRDHLRTGMSDDNVDFHFCTLLKRI